MRWSRDAEEAISKVPFFVNRKVRRKIEFEAQGLGASEVTLQHVHTVKQNFLHKMEDDVKGYRIESCFGSSGCPNRIPTQNNFTEKLEEILQNRNLKTFLKSRVNGPLKFHHEFKVSVSDCPNACSRPQVADVGIIAAVTPVISEAECSRCGACQDACIEQAITMGPEISAPLIDRSRCLSCGHCMKVCPTETLVRGQEGFRIMLGGKLGRHPRLASELTGIFSDAEALQLVDRIIDFYVQHNQRGERLGEMIERIGTQEVEQIIGA